MHATIGEHILQIYCIGLLAPDAVRLVSVGPSIGCGVLDHVNSQQSSREWFCTTNVGSWKGQGTGWLGQEQLPRT